MTSLYRALALFSILSLAQAAPPPPEQLQKQRDRDRDGKLSRDEFPAPRLFDLIDADKDGFVTMEEDRDFRKRRATRSLSSSGSTSETPRSVYGNICSAERTCSGCSQARS